eukprot:1160699-Pelagomonas_calceolata.AAC.7
MRSISGRYKDWANCNTLKVLQWLKVACMLGTSISAFLTSRASLQQQALLELQQKEGVLTLSREGIVLWSLCSSPVVQNMYIQIDINSSAAETNANTREPSMQLHKKGELRTPYVHVQTCACAYQLSLDVPAPPETPASM